jgi:2',3'-cyclic-nucleotide 2'-phosphodiesterase (5'-nucleotidase family)
VRTAQEYVPQIREEADVVVVVTHQQLTRDYEIVDSVEGIDLLLAAHVHDVFFEHGLLRNDTLIAKTSSWGREVGRVDLTLEKGRDGYQVKRAQASLIPVTSEVPEDEEINRILEPYLSETQQYQGYLIPGLATAALVVIAVLVLLMRRAAADFTS